MGEWKTAIKSNQNICIASPKKINFCWCTERKSQVNQFNFKYAVTSYVCAWSRAKETHNSGSWVSIAVSTAEAGFMFYFH